MSAEFVFDTPTTETRVEILETTVARLADKLAALESLVGGGVAETLAPRPDSHASRLGRLECRAAWIEKSR